MEKARLAILVGHRGRGSNMRAIAEACMRGEIPAEVAVVVSPIADNQASLWATEHGIDVEVLSPKDAEYDSRLSMLLGARGVHVVCLAGYMSLLPSSVLDAYPGRVLNVHPALLPKFGGKGMYGPRVHEAVLAAGEKESGATVHLVSERYDEGPILVQLRCPVMPDDTPETLAARVLELEHVAYVQAIRKVLTQE